MPTATALLLCVSLLAAGGASADEPAHAEQPQPVQLIGRVVRVEKDQLTVRVREPGAGERDVTVTADATAEVSISGQRAALADLRPQMFVQVHTVPARGDRPARLTVGASWPEQTGRVVRVEGRKVFLYGRRGGSQRREEFAIETDEQTKVRLPSGPGGLDDLKPGMLVSVLPEVGTAQRITPIQRPGEGAGTPR